MKKKLPISPPSDQPLAASSRTRGPAPAPRSSRWSPTAAPWRCLTEGYSPLLPLSLAALVGTLAIASFAARSNARLAPLAQQAQSAVEVLLSRRSPVTRPSSLPASVRSNPLLARPSRAEPSPNRSAPPRSPSILPGLSPAVPPEQSRVLQRLASLQALAAARSSPPTAAIAPGPRPALALTLRDAIALTLAEPAVKAAYLQQLAQQSAPPRQPWPLSESATLLPSSWSLEQLAAIPPNQPSDWERRAELNQAIALAIDRYRRLLQAQAAVQARQQSLAEAQRLLARQQALVAAGREAPTALLPLQQTAARSDRLLQAAREALASEQWQLLAELELGEDVSLVASEAIAQAIAVPVAARLDPVALGELAQQQHPAYRRDLLNLQIAEQHQQTATVKQNTAAFPLPRPAIAPPGRTAIATDDLPDPGASRAAIAVARARQQLQQTRRELQAAVSAATQSVQTHFTRLEQAQQALAVAEAQFAAQESWQAAGRSSVRSLQAAQENLASQRQAAIAAQIAYLNALAELDRAVGLLPLRWGIVPRD